MSELAYNLSGEKFELPPQATGWRVRRLKPKGAPEVVYGRHGVPLVLPIDADIDDLRHEARIEGRYRLDPIDEHGRSIEAASAGYVCVQPNEPAEVSLVTSRGHSENPVIEAMRMNTELARTVVDRFSMILEASATLLRAAENAGMPQRLPRFFLDDRKKEEEEDEENDGSDEQSEPEAAVPKSGLPAIIDTIVAAGAPALINAIVSGKLKIPGGLGALIDCRRAVSKDRGEAAPQANAPEVGPAPGHRAPAPAPSGTGPRPPAPGSGSATDGSASQHAASAAGASAPDMPEGLPTTDAATMRHFNGILGQLSLDEQMLAQTIAAELSPTDLRTWISDLATMPVADGVAKIRAFLAPYIPRPREVPAAEGTASTTDDTSGALGGGGAT